MSEQAKTVQLYRVENPHIRVVHNADTPHTELTSHPDIVGQWFTPDLDKSALYLRKSTQTFGKESRVVDGAQLVVASVPAEQLDKYHVSRHPIAATMDVENDNYILPRDGTIQTEVLPHDEAIGELRGSLGRIDHLQEARRRVANLVENLGHMAVEQKA